MHAHPALAAPRTGLLIAAAATFVIAASTGQAQANGTPAPSGKALIEANCTACHDSSVFSARAIGRDEWAAILQRMVGYKPELGSLDLKSIEAYLADTYSTTKP